MNKRDIGSAPKQLVLALNGGGQAGSGHSSKLDFSKVCSNEALFASWEKFRRGKRARPDVLLYERYLEENLFNLGSELKNGTYRHGPYYPFTVFDPKRRRIHKALVKDRVVHQAVISAIEPLFEPGFIHDSFSCRVGKGTHSGVKRLRSFLRQASLNNARPVYALKCDIKQFFASVGHQKLLDLLSIRTNDELTLNLLKEIIASFSVSPGRGIPLGNLTSQLFANVYMHEFDWFIKHELRQRHYVRYCDDFVVVDRNRQHLLELLISIENFLTKRLGLSIHPDKIIVRSWNQGIDFVGYVIKPHCTLLRNKTKKRMLKRVNTDNLASYLGLCSHANSHELEQLIRTKAWEAPGPYI